MLTQAKNVRSFAEGVVDVEGEEARERDVGRLSKKNPTTTLT
jgi:hypothetical protein